MSTKEKEGMVAGETRSDFVGLEGVTTVGLAGCLGVVATPLLRWYWSLIVDFG